MNAHTVLWCQGGIILIQTGIPPNTVQYSNAFEYENEHPNTDRKTVETGSKAEIKNRIKINLPLTYDCSTDVGIDSDENTDSYESVFHILWTGVS